MAGGVFGVATGITPSPSHLSFGVHLPHLIWPAWAPVRNGLERAVLLQIPLTLTNAIIVTAAVSRQLFADNSHRVNERNLALTTGLANLLAAPFGGYLMCHGAGGVSGHFRSAPAPGQRRSSSGWSS